MKRSDKTNRYHRKTVIIRLLRSVSTNLELQRPLGNRGLNANMLPFYQYARFRDVTRIYILFIYLAIVFFECSKILSAPFRMKYVLIKRAINEGSDEPVHLHLQRLTGAFVNRRLNVLM